VETHAVLWNEHTLFVRLHGGLRQALASLAGNESAHAGIFVEGCELVELLKPDPTLARAGRPGNHDLRRFAAPECERSPMGLIVDVALRDRRGWCQGSASLQSETGLRLCQRH
jgi:hypothetical protein